jgi:hypothetical protein
MATFCIAFYESYLSTFFPVYTQQIEVSIPSPFTMQIWIAVNKWASGSETLAKSHSKLLQKVGFILYSCNGVHCILALCGDIANLLYEILRADEISIETRHG